MRKPESAAQIAQPAAVEVSKATAVEAYKARFATCGRAHSHRGPLLGIAVTTLLVASSAIALQNIDAEAVSAIFAYGGLGVVVGWLAGWIGATNSWAMLNGLIRLARKNPRSDSLRKWLWPKATIWMATWEATGILFGAFMATIGAAVEEAGVDFNSAMTWVAEGILFEMSVIAIGWVAMQVIRRDTLKDLADGVSLRTILILIGLISLAFWWPGYKLSQARDQRRIIVAIAQLGGGVGYDYEYAPPKRNQPPRTPPGPEWLRNLFSVDLFAVVTHVNLAGSQVDDSSLAYVSELSKLESLNLGGTNVTDNGLRHLDALTRLERLNLANTHITDDGLARLAKLLQLKGLNLSNNKLTDAGVTHLRRMTQLESLNLNNTQVSDAGIQELQSALPTARISIQGAEDRSTAATPQGK